MPTFPDLDTLIRSALSRRREALAGLPLARLFDGAGDGFQALVLDLYDTLLVAHYFPESPEEERRGDARLAIHASLARLEPFLRGAIPAASSLILKAHPHDPKENRARQPELVWGPEAPDSFTLTEGALRYQVRPAGSLFCGLYPDTAFLRRFLGETRAAKVMNTFCFSGALGVASAQEGLEQEILQIDSSPAALDWAKANWELNAASFPQTRMRFLCDDCLNFMDREARRIERGAPKSNLIILDPPSFGRGRNKVFSLKNDAPTLLAAALACLAPEGLLVFTANYKPWPPERLRDLLEKEIQRAGRRTADGGLLRPPETFFPARQPESISVRGAWARVG